MPNASSPIASHTPAKAPAAAGVRSIPAPSDKVRGHRPHGRQTVDAAQAPDRPPPPAASADQTDTSAASIGPQPSAASSPSVAKDAAPPATGETAVVVVGFPDDFSQREFYNMLAFASGLEHAALQTAPAAEDDPVRSLVRATRPVATQRPLNRLTPLTTDACPSMHFSSLLPANARCSLLPCVRLPGLVTRPTPHGHTVAPSRCNKQVGLAKFRTHSDALKARDTLNGRIVDIDRGSVLNAELAKPDLKFVPPSRPFRSAVFESLAPGARGPSSPQSEDAYAVSGSTTAVFSSSFRSHSISSASTTAATTANLATSAPARGLSMLDFISRFNLAGKTTRMSGTSLSRRLTSSDLSPEDANVGFGNVNSHKPSSSSAVAHNQIITNLQANSNQNFHQQHHLAGIGSYKSSSLTFDDKLSPFPDIFDSSTRASFLGNTFSNNPSPLNTTATTTSPLSATTHAMPSATAMSIDGIGGLGTSFTGSTTSFHGPSSHTDPAFSSFQSSFPIDASNDFGDLPDPIPHSSSSSSIFGTSASSTLNHGDHRHGFNNMLYNDSNYLSSRFGSLSINSNTTVSGSVPSMSISSNMHAHGFNNSGMTSSGISINGGMSHGTAGMSSNGSELLGTSVSGLGIMNASTASTSATAAAVAAAIAAAAASGNSQYNYSSSFPGSLNIPATIPFFSGMDQNPPCNTLYVGNLPHDTMEEELRQLFSVQPGFKRLCFRLRSNGPMCFVEFENIEYATATLFKLYGTHLSNSVKGGIRLSYSKNPLGVRQSRPAAPSAAAAAAMAAAAGFNYMSPSLQGVTLPSSIPSSLQGPFNTDTTDYRHVH